MRTLVAALALSVPLAVMPSVASARVAPLEVTLADYRSIEPGMSRTRVERIFGVGKGCQFTSYTIGDVLFTGRQYRNELGNRVSIRYRSKDGGPTRVRAKQWNKVKSC